MSEYNTPAISPKVHVSTPHVVVPIRRTPTGEPVVPSSNHHARNDTMSTNVTCTTDQPNGTYSNGHQYQPQISVTSPSENVEGALAVRHSASPDAAHFAIDEISSHRRMMSAVLDRDKKIAAIGSEVTTMRSKLRATAEANEEKERELSKVKQENSAMRLELEALRSKVVALQSVLDHASVDIERKDEELFKERARRKDVEASAKIADGQHADMVSGLQAQLRQIQEKPRRSLHDLERLQSKLTDQENVVAALKKENYRLVQVLKSHGISPNASMTEPPEYTRILTQQRLKDVPSLKKFSCIPTRDRTPSPNAINRGSAGPSSATRSRTTTGTGTARSRSKSPNAALPRSAASPNHQGGAYKEGQRVMWQGYQGIVRFVGPTHFGEGTWVGVELATKNGEHSGTIDDVKYFTCPMKTGVFCRMWDLQESRAPTREEMLAESAAVGSQSAVPPPPSTVQELRDYQRLYDNL
eukprot:PhM_4_TR4335/c0_g2_i1/m.23375